MTTLPIRLGLLFRKMPMLKGKLRVARALLYPVMHDEPVELPFGRFKVRFPAIKEPIAFEVLVNGYYEPEMVKFIRTRLTQKGGAFLDIGANVGLFSLVAAETQTQQGRDGFAKGSHPVVAVDASPRNFSYLRHNVAQIADGVIVPLNRAVYLNSGSTLSFYEAPATHQGMSALAPQFDVAPLLVETVTLDDIITQNSIGSVSLIKVDVEGYEYAVFQGGQRLLSSPDAPAIVFEFIDWAEGRVGEIEIGESQRILRDYGYQLWHLNDYLQGKPKLNAIITEGGTTILALKP